MELQRKFIRGILIVLALAILVSVFLFQQFNYYSLFTYTIGQPQGYPHIAFIVNKTIRLLLNDIACMMIILAIFRERKYIQVAFYVFLFEILIILPVYFFIKLSIEGDSEISSPLLSMVHRLIINPTLMILLIMGFFYQNKFSQFRK